MLLPAVLHTLDPASRQLSVDAGILESPALQALTLAYQRTPITPKSGTTTVCVVGVVEDDDGQLQLTAANLGDSGFSMFRPHVGLDAVVRWAPIVRAAPQQHGFNVPKQLGFRSSDRPWDANSYWVPTQPGDVILSYTDGVSDNLFEKDLIAVLDGSAALRKALAAPHDTIAVRMLLTAVATEVVAVATAVGANNSADTPFSRGAKNYKGGKPDDVTCVVSVVAGKKQP